MRKEIAIKQLHKLTTLGMLQPMRLAAEEWKKDWHTLIAIMLSARTRDETAIRSAHKLFDRFPTLQSLAQASETHIQECIGSVNFFRNKSRSVLGCARTLVTEYAGKVPHHLDTLVSIPGVGRKTANVFMAEYGTPAIGVDTHVAYISRALGWTKHSDPRKIENDLMKLFPQKYWLTINRICVRFGKTYMSKKKKDELLLEIKGGNNPNSNS